MAEPSIIAMIPARAGSKRVVGKNVRVMGGHPLIAYSIAAARSSGVFDAVVVSTDSEEYAAIARHYGAEVPFLRAPEFSGDTSPDIEWVRHTLQTLKDQGRAYDCFSILRPTSPFRKAVTIQRAWKEFLAEEGVDSLRAVEKCGQHPAKMWVVRDHRMTPLMPLSPPERPWHSMQYQALPVVHVQNASLEIAWSRVPLDGGSIAGHVLMPFLTEGDEGVDVNIEADWFWAEHLLATGKGVLPTVETPAWPGR